MTNLRNKSLLNSGKSLSPAAFYLKNDCFEFGLNFEDTVQDLIASNGLNLLTSDSHFKQDGDVDWSIIDFDHTLRYEFAEYNDGEGCFCAHVIEFDRYGFARRHWTE